MRPIVWGFILTVIGGIFWVMFSVVYGIIGGVTGEVPTEGLFLVSALSLITPVLGMDKPP
ncbi:MAG: hypothetical protein QXZ53_07270 [Candidatus Bathyarchaeia archaeon]